MRYTLIDGKLYKIIFLWGHAALHCACRYKINTQRDLFQRLWTHVKRCFQLAQVLREGYCKPRIRMQENLLGNANLFNYMILSYDGLILSFPPQKFLGPLLYGGWLPMTFFIVNLSKKCFGPCGLLSPSGQKQLLSFMEGLHLRNLYGMSSHTSTVSLWPL